MKKQIVPVVLMMIIMVFACILSRYWPPSAAKYPAIHVVEAPTEKPRAVVATNAVLHFEGLHAIPTVQ
jgi:uncharacterized membrane protein YedE/YeeE